MSDSFVGPILRGDSASCRVMTEAEIDEVLDGVKGLLDGGIDDILVFYYPRDWRMGEIIWTPAPENWQRL